MLKFISIKLIILYQVVAPKKIRENCRFEPTCSNYAIIAIKKYGFLVGWKKTFNRLIRCKSPNCGVDNP